MKIDEEREKVITKFLESNRFFDLQVIRVLRYFVGG